MAQETPRIAELRRRVQADPASIAFAQLAEEYRRAGHFDEAARYCRAGLARHPGYLSARVTLGRSLMELNELDEAISEFELVLRSAPDNLAAVRAMAELHQRRGDMPSALDYYKRALALARFDAELEEHVARISRDLAQIAAAVPGGHANGTPAGQPPVDFDALLAALGAPDAAPPPVVEHLLSGATSVLVDARSLPPADGTLDPHDAFATLEHALRDGGPPPAPASAAISDTYAAEKTAAVPPSGEPANEMIVQELEAWLSVIMSARTTTSGA